MHPTQGDQHTPHNTKNINQITGQALHCTARGAELAEGERRGFLECTGKDEKLKKTKQMK